MRPELVISKIYQDVDIVEVTVTAWNGLFGGSVDLYVGQDELEQFANTLRCFPTSPTDQRHLVIGTFDPKFAGGGASMDFFCIDRAGHVQLDIKLESDHSQAKHKQRAELFANLEPASIDDFVLQLIAVGQNTRELATLRFSDVIMRS